MKKFVRSFSILSLLFFSLYASRHFFITAALEYGFKRATGTALAYNARYWEDGRLNYEGLSYGRQLYAEEAALDFNFHLFPFSINAAVHLTSPTVQVDDAESTLNLAFLLPTKFWIPKLDIEKGNLISAEKSLCNFDFTSGENEDLGTLSVYQDDGSSLFTCRFNYQAGSLAADFEMNEAPLNKTVPLASLFISLPRGSCKAQGSSIFGIILADFRFFLQGSYTQVDMTPAKKIENQLKRTQKSTEPEFCNYLSTWKSVEGTASAVLKGTLNAKEMAFLQGHVALQNVRLESDELIFAVDKAAGQINFQGEMETFALDTDFNGVDLFWKELEVLRGEGSIVFKPHETPIFEAHAAVHLADLEGRADLVGKGEILENQSLWLEGTLDYVTANNPLKVDFTWADDGKSQVLQTDIRNLGKEILALFPSWNIKQGRVDGGATVFLNQGIFEHLQLDHIQVHQLAIDKLSIQEIELQGSVNLLSGDIEQMTMQAHDAEGQYQGWSISSANGTFSIRDNNFEPSSAFGKLEGIPFAAEFQGPFSTLHASAKLSAGASEWFKLPKNPQEPPIILDLVIDRKQEELQMSGTLTCLEDTVQLNAQGHISTSVLKGGFQTSRLQSSFYTPFLKIFAPTLAVQGDLSLRGQFSENAIDILAQGDDLIVASPEFQLSIPGHSRELLYHFDFKEKKGDGKGQLSPLVITTRQIPISITGGDIVFDNTSISCHLQGIEGALTSTLYFQDTSCSAAFDFLENQLIVQNLRGILSESITFTAQQIGYQNGEWDFDAAFDQNARSLLTLQGKATPTAAGYHVILQEAKASASYLKGPLSFHWSPPSKMDQVRGVVYIDAENLAQQLTLLDQLGLFVLTPHVKEILDHLQGSMTLRLIIDAERSEYEIQGSQIGYAPSLFNAVSAHLIQEGNEWSLKRCSLDDIEIKGNAAYLNAKWLVSALDINWKDLRLHTTGIYEKEKFDFKLDGQIASRFILNGTGIFFSSTPHFQNLSCKVLDQTDPLAFLHCEKLTLRRGKWESPELNLTVFSKQLVEPLKTQLKLSLSSASTTFQGPSQGEAKLGSSTLKITQISGLYEAPYLHLKCAGALDDEPLQFLGKFSKDHQFGGGINIQKGKELLKLSLSDPTTCQKAEGELCGIQVSLQRESQGFKGTVLLKERSKLIPHLKDFSGLRLTGLFNSGAFKGELEGHEAQLYDYVVQELHATIDYTPTRFKLKNLTLQDPAGSLAIKECNGFRSEIVDSWNITIPLLKGQEIKPSAIRKLGAPEKEIKPLQIRYFVMTDILGQLGDLQSFRGLGTFNFTQRIKKEPSLFDIPLAMLKDLGLDLDMFSPVMGEVKLQLKDGKLFFTDLQNAFSEGKRSEFYLAGEPSFIDLNGDLHLNLRMQQNAVLKLVEPFMITVRGTWEKPKYSLR